MSDNLLIVESHAKARKIYSLLKNLYPEDVWEVVASFGHIVDLPVKKMGVDLATLEPYWEVDSKKRKTLKKILDMASDVDMVWLGTDDDREGEAIAAHLRSKIIDRYPTMDFNRIRFHEITRQAIKAAVEEPGEIDAELFQAQLARRILDRLVGYRITPILWKNLGPKLTAGRVQTCALRLLVDRELERRGFETETYWRVTVSLKGGSTLYSTKHLTQKKAMAVVEELNKTQPTPTFSDEDAQDKPKPAFVTSSLLQSATRQLGIKSDEVMRQAQQLYEGGLITYHRTDSIAIGKGFCAGATQYIKGVLGDEYVQFRPWSGKGAHECIRPTDAHLEPSQVPTNLRKLYRLIWAKALASQSTPAELKKQKLTMKVLGVELVGHGTEIVFDGHFRPGLDLFRPKFHTIDKNNIEFDSTHAKECKTEPPANWTEPALIQKLEKEGVGRPSTYASIIKTLYRHRYITYRGHSMVPTLKGILLGKFFEDNLPELTYTSFTAQMEYRLDRVAEGNEEYSRKIVLEEYNAWLNERLRQLENAWVLTDAKCPSCDTLLEVWFAAKSEPFLQCTEDSGGCDSLHGLDVNSEGVAILFVASDVDGTCRHCKKVGALTTASGKYGLYIKCKDCNKAHKEVK